MANLRSCLSATLLLASLCGPALAGTSARPPLDTAASPAISRLMNGSLLNKPLRDLETDIASPGGLWRSYQVNGCHFSVWTTGNAVSAIRLELNKRCTFDAAAILPDILAKPAHNLTFSDLGPGTVLATCLSSCGNTRDPSIYLRAERAFPNGIQEIVFEAGIVDGPAFNAGLRWEKAIRQAKGEVYTVSARFNCDGAFNRTGLEVVKDVPVGYITIGHRIPTPADSCASGIAPSPPPLTAPSDGIDAEPAVLSRLMNGTLLGLPLSEFEAALSPEAEPWRTYQVSGCTVSVSTRDGAVLAIKLELDRHCAVNPAAFLPQPVTEPVETLTFGQLGQGTAVAICPQGCHKPRELTAYLHQVRPNGAGEFLFETRIDGGAELDAFRRWASAMVKERGEEYTAHATFNCDGTLEFGLSVLNDVPVASVTIGYNLLEPTRRCLT